jgi:hypothetical protein
VIDAAEQIPVDVQPHHARAIEDGVQVGGPRILALVGYDPSAGPPPYPPNSGMRCLADGAHAQARAF